jgi:hypothetical protein
MMAEYIALSTGMLPEVLPSINVFNEICDAFEIERLKDSRVVRTCFGDNEGAKACY